MSYRESETKKHKAGDKQEPLPAPAHPLPRGLRLGDALGASHLLDGAQRVRVLLLRLLDLPQAAAPLVVLGHLGLPAGRRGRCWGARGCPSLRPPRPATLRHAPAWAPAPCA